MIEDSIWSRIIEQKFRKPTNQTKPTKPTNQSDELNTEFAELEKKSGVSFE